MNERILFVDDEPNILAVAKRQLHNRYRVETALSGRLGLLALAHKGPFAVAVADMHMAGMDGVQFLQSVKKISPETVRIMLTGDSDLSTAIEAINQGSIFRFLTKPCPKETLLSALDAAVKQHRLITAEKELLHKTLRGAIKVLTDILALVNPTAFGRASRVTRLVKQIASQLKLENSWQIEIAAMLSQIGCVTIPQQILNKVYRGKQLSPQEKEIFDSHPKIGRELIANIPRLELVAEIIASQEVGLGEPIRERKEKERDLVALAGSILKLAQDFDTQLILGKTYADALEQIRSQQGRYGDQLVEALHRALAQKIESQIETVPVDSLAPGMILADDVKTQDGVLLITKGQEVTRSLRFRLMNFARVCAIDKLVKVIVPEHTRRPGEGGASPSRAEQAAVELDQMGVGL